MRGYYAIDQRIRLAHLERWMPPAPCSAFEVGVGTGGVFRYFKEKGYDIRGCDISLNDLPADFPYRDFVTESNGACLPIPDNSYDCVISSDVLEHVYPEQREKFLKEMIRITKPGGRIVLTAFFHCSFTFRIYGAARLMRFGNLPTWYLEHLAIKNPIIDETLAILKGMTHDVQSRRYQGCLNLLALTAKDFCGGRFRILQKPFDACWWPVNALDFLGQKTSCVFRATKNLQTGTP